MLSLLEAYEILARNVHPIGDETVPLQEAGGRVLSREVRAPSAYPRFNQSAMDGYAIHSLDLHRRTASLQVIGVSQAGTMTLPTLTPGTTVRVFTGAPIPEHTGAVRIQEEVEKVSSDVIHLESPTPEGINIRWRGSDLENNCLLLNQGRCLTPADIMCLANLKVETVQVFRQPEGLIATTGNELVDLNGPPLKFGQVVDGNRVFLRTVIGPLMTLKETMPRLDDDPEHIQAFLKDIQALDVVFTCGGMSVGDFDILGRSVRDMSEVLLYKIAVKPGKPILIARLGSTLFVGLPGNPVSTFVGFHLIVRPLLGLLTGQSNVFPCTQLMRLKTEMGQGGGRLEFLRGRAEVDSQGEWTVILMSNQGSNAISGSLRCNCLVVRAKGQGARAAGEYVQVYRLDGGPKLDLDRFRQEQWPRFQS
ncbi:MAG: molybdopterin molybdotransferase MoeA [Bradymonadia bacterium]